MKAVARSCGSPLTDSTSSATDKATESDQGLRGGIPPALFTGDLGPQGAALVLTGADGTRLPMDAYLPLAGRPVRIRGHVLEKDGLWTLRTTPADITQEP